MKNRTTSRRAFLGSSILGLSTYWWPDHRETTHKMPPGNTSLARSDTTAFLCESGNLGKDDTFTVGLLLLPSPDHFEQYVRQLRQQFRYYPRLSYATNDHFQLPLARYLIDWLFSKSEACFQVMAFSGKVSSTSPHYPDSPSRWQILRQRQAYYDELLTKATINDQMVYVKYQSPLGPSPAYSQRFFSSTSNYYQAIDTRSSNALQVCGLLTSCVAAAQRKQPLSPIKASLVRQLCQALDNQELRPALRWKDRFVFYA